MKLTTIAKLRSGSPQFRITESFDPNSPIYKLYGQAELEADLKGMEADASEVNEFRTFDRVDRTNSGDLIFSLISGRAAIVKPIHAGYLMTQNYVVFEVNPKIDKKFLLYLMNENKQIKRQLRVGLQGTSVHKYTISQLKMLKLPPLPKLADQKIVGEVYLKQLHLQALRERVASLESILVMNKLERKSENE